MEVIPDDMIEEFKLGFKGSVEGLIRDLGVRLGEISGNTGRMVEVQRESVLRMCSEVDKGVTASHEFKLHCEVLMGEFERLDELAEQVKAMRKNCEELEKKLARVKV